MTDKTEEMGGKENGRSAKRRQRNEYEMKKRCKMWNATKEKEKGIETNKGTQTK